MFSCYRSLAQRARSLAPLAHSPRFARNHARSLAEPRCENICLFIIYNLKHGRY